MSSTRRDRRKDSRAGGGACFRPAPLDSIPACPSSLSPLPCLLLQRPAVLSLQRPRASLGLRLLLCHRVSAG